MNEHEHFRGLRGLTSDRFLGYDLRLNFSRSNDRKKKAPLAGSGASSKLGGSTMKIAGADGVEVFDGRFGARTDV